MGPTVSTRTVQEGSTAATGLEELDPSQPRSGCSSASEGGALPG